MTGGRPIRVHSPSFTASRRERGFALLLVFALAASVAIMLHLELPRLAFESQRVKEDLLQERGQQYSRAVQLYVRKFSNYPATIEALENTNNVRYLRRRYKDPLTGKDEWRLIHVGPGGIFTDSLVYDKVDPTKNKDQQEKDKDKGKDAEKTAEPTNTFIVAGPAFGSAPAAFPAVVQPGSLMRRRRRPTDRNLSAGPGGTLPPDPTISPDEPAPFATPEYPRTGVSSQTGGAMPTPWPSIAQQPGTGMASFAGPAASAAGPGAPNPAIDMIRRILTTPRPGGLAGLQGQGVGGAQIGGGIAGVASMVEEEGIKVYKERKKYNEWEFVYDIRKDPLKTAGMGLGGGGGLPGQITPQTGSTPFGPTPFGTIPTQPSQPYPSPFPIGPGSRGR